MKRLSRSALAATALLCAAGHADVREVQPTTFTVESSVQTATAPAAVYSALSRKVGLWWDPAHTWSGSAGNMSIDARAGGCFCEKLPGGGSVQHARVIWAQPGKILRLEGAFGPLQDMAVNAVMTFTLAPEGPGTKVTMKYRVSGSFTMDAAKLAPLVDQVLAVQLARLGRFAESGRAEK